MSHKNLQKYRLKNYNLKRLQKKPIKLFKLYKSFIYYISNYNFYTRKNYVK